MKTILLFTLLALTFNINGQIKHPFPDSTGQWVDFWSVTDNTGTYAWKDTTFIDGDTIIQGKKYSIAKGGFYEDSYFRVDSLKVYHRFAYTPTPLDTGEILMYDFGLQVGDTFDLGEIEGYPTFFNKVSKIDSVMYNGSYYKKFHFDSYYAGFYWVEGIGSSQGFLPFMFYLERAHVFNCFHRNGLDYEFDLMGTSSCGILPLGIKKHNITDIEVYPNPTSRELNIDMGNTYTNIDITVLNLAGGQVMSTTRTNKQQLKLNLQKLTSGIYFIEVVADGQSSVIKIVKK